LDDTNGTLYKGSTDKLFRRCGGIMGAWAVNLSGVNIIRWSRRLSGRFGDGAGSGRERSCWWL